MENMIQKLFIFLLISSCPFKAWATVEDLPKYHEVMQVMDTIAYSGVPIIIDPKVFLDINFSKREWTIKNMHQYDAKGNLKLEQDRYGLCAELSAYLFEKIKVLFAAPRYALKFAMVTEPSFFTKSQSNHIILMLFDKINHQVYLMDPSFHKYAPLKDFASYKIVNTQNNLSFLKEHLPDISFGVNQAVPLYIKGDYLLNFALTSIDGKFDKHNFIFVISAVRRYKTEGRDIVIIGRHNKEFEDLQDKVMLDQLLTSAEIKVLFDKIKTWVQQVPV